MDGVSAESPRQKSLATRLLHPPKVTQDPYGAVAPPLYQTATFDQVSAVQCGPYDYTRSGNPTRDQLEAQMADLEVPLSHALFACMSHMLPDAHSCCNAAEGPACPRLHSALIPPWSS